MLWTGLTVLIFATMLRMGAPGAEYGIVVPKKGDAYTYMR